jgi:predicted transcriptional regulator
MSIEDKVLEVVANKEVISLKELEKECNINSISLGPIISKLKEEGYVCISNLIAPTTIAVTAKGKNSIENK